MTVLLAVLDGVRPDALSVVRCPNLDRIRDLGASTLHASSVTPSITLPCHVSMFHSVPPSRHGILTNDWTPMARPLPGLIEQAHTAGLRCASIYNWEPLRNLGVPERLEFSYFRNNAEDGSNGDHVLAEEAVRYISSDRPDFLFVYFGTVDVAGHAYGWMSDEYLTQVERVDGALGTLLDGLPANSTALVLSDHGGHDRTHGTDSPEDMTIPWMVAGPGIRRGHQIKSGVTLLDTAPSLARVLGISLYSGWEGHCIEEIFEQGKEDAHK